MLNIKIFFEKKRIFGDVLSMRCVLRYQMEAVAKIWGGCTVENFGRKVGSCRLNVEQSSHQKKKKKRGYLRNIKFY